MKPLIGIALVLFTLFTSVDSSAQIALNITTSGFQAQISTTISPGFDATEASVGLFYRLDRTDKQGSYYWDTTFVNPAIIGGSPTNTITQVLQLPAGDYDVICYQTRKGGPIGTGHGHFSITSGGTTGSPTMPSVFTGPVSPSTKLMLESSWNVFTTNTLVAPYTNHFVNSPVNVTSYCPTSPWIFVTMSVYNWGNGSINVNYNSNNLDYIGAIADNYYYGPGTISYENWANIQSVTAYPISGNISVRKNNSPLPLNGEIHLHLIFANKTGNTLQSLNSVSFTASMEVTGSGSITSITSPQVKGTPHDPNSLKVDQSYLCPCRSNEKLTYQVTFQNIGKAPATKVTVKLKNFAPLLDVSSVDLQNTLHTYIQSADVSYDNATQTFTVSRIELLGTNQTRTPNPVQEWETMDYFKFKINKAPCTLTGTMIQPKVDIVFYDSLDVAMDNIETNISTTHVVAAFNEQNCNLQTSAECPNCASGRKRGWWRKLFCRNCN